LLALSAAHAAELPIFDAHLHYSHDTWDNLPPKIALDLLRQAASCTLRTTCSSLTYPTTRAS